MEVSRRRRRCTSRKENEKNKVIDKGTLRSIVGAGWCVSFTTWGFVNAYGLFQAQYSTNQLADYSPSAISWIGSVQLSMILASGIVVGRAFDRGHLRVLMLVGTAIYFVSLIGLSFATTYAQIFVAQGFGCGVSSFVRSLRRDERETDEFCNPPFTFHHLPNRPSPNDAPNDVPTTTDRLRISLPSRRVRRFALFLSPASDGAGYSGDRVLIRWSRLSSPPQQSVSEGGICVGGAGG